MSSSMPSSYGMTTDPNSVNYGGMNLAALMSQNSGQAPASGGLPGSLAQLMASTNAPQQQATSATAIPGTTINATGSYGQPAGYEPSYNPDMGSVINQNTANQLFAGGATQLQQMIGGNPYQMITDPMGTNYWLNQAPPQNGPVAPTAAAPAASGTVAPAAAAPAPNPYLSNDPNSVNYMQALYGTAGGSGSPGSFTI